MYVCVGMYMYASMCVHVCMYMLTGQVEDATGEHTEMYQTVKVLYKCESDENGKKYCTRIHVCTHSSS